jgi:predicted RNA polymerase sigma factor
VSSGLVRTYDRFDACEDAVQEAQLAAAQQRPSAGVPDNPRSWLVAVSSRRLIDEWRSESARWRREEAVTALKIEPGPTEHSDDTLTLSSTRLTVIDSVYQLVLFLGVALAVGLVQ